MNGIASVYTVNYVVAHLSHVPFFLISDLRHASR